MWLPEALSVDNETYIAGRHAIALGYALLGLAVSVGISYLIGICAGKPNDAALFSIPILHVGKGRSRKQVVRANTYWVVAGVTALWTWLASVLYVVRKSMCQKRLNGTVNLPPHTSIARGLSSYPNPTIAIRPVPWFRVDLAPKRFTSFPAQWRYFTVCHGLTT